MNMRYVGFLILDGLLMQTYNNSIHAIQSMYSNSITKVIHKIKQLKQQQQVRLNSKFQITCLSYRKMTPLP
jgi:hypothetical protein